MVHKVQFKTLRGDADRDMLLAHTSHARANDFSPQKSYEMAHELVMTYLYAPRKTIDKNLEKLPDIERLKQNSGYGILPHMLEFEAKEGLDKLAAVDSAILTLARGKGTDYDTMVSHLEKDMDSSLKNYEELSRNFTIDTWDARDAAEKKFNDDYHLYLYKGLLCQAVKELTCAALSGAYDADKSVLENMVTAQESLFGTGGSDHQQESAQKLLAFDMKDPAIV